MPAETGPEVLDTSLDKETLHLRARQILAGALHSFPELILLSRIQKIKDGYRVKFRLGEDALSRQSAPERTAVLDLAFPIEVRPIAEVIEQHQKAGRELFLGIGAGVSDYPKKINMDPKESRRAFFASDISYGLMPHEDNFASLALPKRYMMSSKMLREPWPASTHFLNAFDYRAMPNDAFDTIQMVNVLTDPKVTKTPMQEALRMLKPDTGEFVIMNELGRPESHSLFQSNFMLKAYGGIIQEVIFYVPKEESQNSVDTVNYETLLLPDFSYTQNLLPRGLESGTLSHTPK